MAARLHVCQEDPLNGKLPAQEVGNAACRAVARGSDSRYAESCSVDRVRLQAPTAELSSSSSCTAAACSWRTTASCCRCVIRLAGAEALMAATATSLRSLTTTATDRMS